MEKINVTIEFNSIKFEKWLKEIEFEINKRLENLTKDCITIG
jgi:hypothetical protein